MSNPPVSQSPFNAAIRDSATPALGVRRRVVIALRASLLALALLGGAAAITAPDFPPGPTRTAGALVATIIQSIQPCV